MVVGAGESVRTMIRTRGERVQAGIDDGQREPEAPRDLACVLPVAEQIQDSIPVCLRTCQQLCLRFFSGNGAIEPTVVLLDLSNALSGHTKDLSYLVEGPTLLSQL